MSAGSAFNVVVWGFILLVLLGLGIMMRGAVRNSRANNEAIRGQ